MNRPKGWDQLSPELKAKVNEYIALLQATQLELDLQAGPPIIAAGSPPPPAAIANGGQWIEEKMIPKKTRAGTKLYGPYRYLYRWDAGSKKRIFVKYLGKVKSQPGGSGTTEAPPDGEPETN